MPSKLPLVTLALALCGGAPAQSPPTPTLTLTFQQALERARANSPQLVSANLSTLMAHEDTVQAKAALLPAASGLSQFIYTQPNNTLTGIFVSNDGPRVYNEQLTVHADLYAPSKLADYHRTQFAEDVARAKADIAARGLTATVVDNYYAMVSAKRKLANARQSQSEVQHFFEITQMQERAGEAAHSDTVLAQVLVVQRQRETSEAELGVYKARLAFSVLLFPDFRQDFDVVDDLDAARLLPPFTEVQGLAGQNNPDIRAAQAAVEQENFEVKSARAARLPTIGFDYFYGLNSNQFALHDQYGRNNLGSVAQAQLNIPLWTWGALRSRISQAELHLQQAKTDLSFTQRQLLANLNSFYLEAQTAAAQIASLGQSLELSADSLRLTLLRYQGGECTALEVKDAQATVVDARNAFDDGKIRYRVALADLQTLTGAF